MPGIAFTVPAITLGTQGILLSGIGLFATIRPNKFMELQHTGDIAMVRVFSMSALSLGVIYCVTACHPSVHRHALLANAGLRAIATIVFWQGTRGTAIYEAVWGLLNAAAATTIDRVT